MNRALVVVRWFTECFRCGHEHTQETNVQAPGIEHAPPPVPNYCEGCGRRLREDRHVWRRTLEVVEVQEC